MKQKICMLSYASYYNRSEVVYYKDNLHGYVQKMK